MAARAESPSYRAFFTMKSRMVMKEEKRPFGFFCFDCDCWVFFSSVIVFRIECRSIGYWGVTCNEAEMARRIAP